ncbi:glycosyltransferase [bacterium]|nr:glycosyltransferase [bacterium]
MPDMPVVCIVGYSVFYLVVSLVLAAGIMRLRRRKPPGDEPTVSVVVCARNEERVIRRCIDSLVELDYPRDKTEVILVDDESDDSTPAILEEYASRYPFLTVLSTESEPRDLPAKQRPLNLGINHAHGEIVLLTDADCAVKPGWVRAHVAAYHGSVGISGGITVVSGKHGGLFARIQGCELVTKLAAAMGAAGLGLPVTIMGNNISFRRQAYDASGGFSRIEPNIVEDMALVNAVVGQTGYRLGWAVGGDGVAVTMPEDSFRKFIHQRLRWITGMGNFSMTGKVLMGIEIMMSLVFIASLVFARCNPAIPLIPMLSWFSGYVILLCAVPGSAPSDFVLIPGMLLFQSLYGCVLLWRIVAGNRAVEWKGRIYRSNNA